MKMAEQNNQQKKGGQQRQEAKENGLPFMEKGEMNDGKN